MLTFHIPRLISVGLLACLPILFPAQWSGASAQDVERVTLNERNWDEYAPHGKEVDAIYGDIVLRNEKIVAVIARPARTRNANMTVRNVGGAIIDLTSRVAPNDQLSCYYPGGDRLQFHDPQGMIPWADANQSGSQSESNGITIIGKTVPEGRPAKLTYQLDPGSDYLTVTTTITNDSAEPFRFDLPDAIRADRTFSNQISVDQRMISVEDEWFYQAYAVFAAEPFSKIKFTKPKGNRQLVFTYDNDHSKPKVIPPGEELTWTRYLFPGNDNFALAAIADSIRASEGIPLTRVDSEILIRDSFGPVADAKVTIRQNEKGVNQARTNRSGVIRASLAPGEFDVVVTADGRQPTRVKILAEGDSVKKIIDVPPVGFVESYITDGNGSPIPCKVAFHGIEGTPDPNFGPDSRAVSVKNLRYSANGKFKQGLGPGMYEVIVSHGPEFDAEIIELVVSPAQTTELSVQLNRSVDTTGWISTDFHSHSSESGDNTSDQLGRVLNLLAEQFDFAPCTEHNRVDSYLPHLQKLNAIGQMATCPGMELTGGPLPINHQNAFPLLMRPRTQDGGGPRTSADPLIQIERLKFWDDHSEKLVQMNHPNLVTILGDKDSDGHADEGFEPMFGFVDVVEVHPLSTILSEATSSPPGKRGNVIFNWLQLLNQGYRMPGVVNADAHYNFHGSGFLRNYIRCSTDNPAEIDTMEVVRNTVAGRIVMSNGPFVSVQARGQRLGDDQKISGEIGDELVLKKESVKLDLKIQCANWYDINRVQILVNGRPAENLNFTRRENKQMFGNGVVKFEQTIDVPLVEDSHLIVIAAGEGLQLGRVMGPAHGKNIPIAVTNPIFVDIDGDGFQPNRDALGVPMLMKQK